MTLEDAKEWCFEFLGICDLCHDYFALEQIRITFEGYIYCDGCLKGLEK